MITPAIVDKKLSMYGKPIKMIPVIKLFDKKDQPNLKAGLKFWPEPEEDTDDRLPESK
jgi:hypothetical protein